MPTVRDAGVRVLGRGGLFINVMGLGGAVMFLVFAILIATSPSNSLGATLGDATLFGLMATILLLAATTSVRVDGSKLVLVRLLSITSLPLVDITRASGDDGLKILTGAGITYTHIGYGSWLIGSLTGNHRSTRAAQAVRAAVEQAAISTTSPAGSFFDQASSRPLPVRGSALHVLSGRWARARLSLAPTR